MKREFMQFINDMGTQMLIQKVKNRCQQDVRETIRVVKEEIEDERFVKMGEYYEEERDAVLREIIQRK